MSRQDDEIGLVSSSHQPLRGWATEHLQAIRQILAEHVQDRAVWAFGSRVNGKACESGDLDLAILGDTPLTLAQVGLLKDAFESSGLPFRIDVVDFCRASEEFREVIRAGHEVVRESNSV